MSCTECRGKGEFVNFDPCPAGRPIVVVCRKCKGTGKGET